MSEATLQALFKCPWCGHVNCLLGLASHALSVHRKNLLAWSCKHSPRHEHAFSSGKTGVRYVVIPGGRRGRGEREQGKRPRRRGRPVKPRQPKRREPKKSRREVGVTLLRSEA